MNRFRLFILGALINLAMYASLGATLLSMSFTAKVVAADAPAASRDWNQNGREDVYEDSSQTAEARAADLLAQMTLEEKIGQMMQVDLKALRKHPEHVRTMFLGSVLSGGTSDPADNQPATWLAAVNGLKSQALQTRLKIPLIYGIDAVHGHNNVLGAVIFPHNIGLGATRNPDLVRAAAKVTAEEVAGTGIRWAFAPCVAVARDARWGRCYESFGQSPELAGELGAAAVSGLQGPALGRDSVLACVKHFAGDGGTVGGENEGDTVCDEAAFRKLFIAPYLPALKAGTESIMVSFSSWNGLKMHGNKYLLTDVLKSELGFRGFLVSDWAAIDQLGPDYQRCIETSINAGLDMVMIPWWPPHTNNYVEFFEGLKRLVIAGKVPESRIDDAVRRILRVKFQMGLFDRDSTSPELTASIGSPAHRMIARQCVRESLVLLKNSGAVLPLKKDLRELAVVGIAADDLGRQCGGWTIDWQGKTGRVTTGGTTLLEAIRQIVDPKTKVVFSPDGNDLGHPDAVIVVVSELPYAETKGDRQDLNLPAADQALIAQVRKAGAPVITVLYSGRPLLLGAALDESNAMVAAWLPGTEGLGISDVLFGDAPFKGKLPRLWPANDTQLSVDQMSGAALFPAGFGLTYEN